MSGLAQWAMLEIDTPDPRWAQVAAAITAPALVIAGGVASPMPQDHVANMTAALSGGRLVTIEAGHVVHHHQPRAFTDAVGTSLDP